MPDHVSSGEFVENFPTSVDEFPTPVDNEDFIDALYFNELAARLLNVEDYLIDHKETIETGGAIWATPETISAINETPLTVNGVAADLASGGVVSIAARLSSP